MIGRHEAGWVPDTRPAGYEGQHRADDVAYVCDKCRRPAEDVEGQWLHAEPADAVFCQLIFGPVPGACCSGLAS